MAASLQDCVSRTSIRVLEASAASSSAFSSIVPMPFPRVERSKMQMLLRWKRPFQLSGEPSA